jgi:hypothetical protein
MIARGNLDGNIDRWPTVAHVDGSIRLKNVTSIGQAKVSVVLEITVFAKIIVE